MTMVEPGRIGIVAAFAATLVAATALMAAVLWALDTFAGVSLGSGGAGIVPPMVAAIVAGQRHAIATRAMPRPGYAWSVSLAFVAVTCALSAAGIGLLYATDPLGMGQVFGNFVTLLTRAEILAATFVLLLVLWGIQRWAYSFGARTQLKAQAKAGT